MAVVTKKRLNLLMDLSYNYKSLTFSSEVSIVMRLAWRNLIIQALNLTKLAITLSRSKCVSTGT